MHESKCHSCDLGIGYHSVTIQNCEHCIWVGSGITIVKTTFVYDIAKSQLWRLHLYGTSWCYNCEDDSCMGYGVTAV